MGSIISGITKIFTSLGTGVATLGNAVRGVGSALFTGLAASGTGMAGASSGGGLLSSLFGGGGGGGVLGNILGGALKQGLASGLVGGLVGEVTGEGFGKGFKTGAITGAITGGASGLFTPTGFAASDGFGGGGSGLEMAGGSTATGATVDNIVTGSTTAGTSAHAIERGRDLSLGGATTTATNAFPTTPAAPTMGAGWKGLGDFLSSNAGSSLIGGIGESLMTERILEAKKEEAEANREYLRKEQQRVTDSYNVSGDAYLGGAAMAGAAKTATAKNKNPKWTYNPGTGMIDYA
jgi:hypothetical protein